MTKMNLKGQNNIRSEVATRVDELKNSTIMDLMSMAFVLSQVQGVRIFGILVHLTGCHKGRANQIFEILEEFQLR